MRIRENPLILPQEKLIDDMFQQTMYVMKQDIDLLKAIPKCFELSEIEQVKILERQEQILLESEADDMLDWINKIDTVRTESRNYLNMLHKRLMDEYTKEINNDALKERLAELRTRTVLEPLVAAKRIRKEFAFANSLVEFLDGIYFSKLREDEHVPQNHFSGLADLLLCLTKDADCGAILVGEEVCSLLEKYKVGPVPGFISHRVVGDLLHAKEDLQTYGDFCFDLFESKMSDAFVVYKDVAKKKYNIPYNIVLEVLHADVPRDHSHINTAQFNTLENETVVVSVFCRNDRFMGLFGFGKTPDAIFQMLVHENVHLYQFILGGGFERKESEGMYTGLSTPRGETYRQYMLAAESAMKDEWRLMGKDPGVVDFHTLDDIEFYTKLLDEIVAFLTSRFMYTTDKKGAESFISTSYFFKTLYEIQSDKYELAASEFLDAVLNHKETIIKNYIDYRARLTLKD